MEDLRALVRIVSNQRIKKIDLFNEKEKIPFKIRELYDLLKSKQVSSDEEALKELYETSGQKKNYVKLKHRLRDRLLNTLFFIDFNQANFTTYRKSLHEISKNFVLIKILIDRTERNVAIKIAERTFQMAMKYEMIEFSLLICRELMRHFAFLQPNQKKYKTYSQHMNELKPILDAELLSEKYYCEISNLQAKKKEVFDKSKLDLLEQYCTELRGIQKTIKSNRFNLDTFQLCIYYHFKKREYSKVLDLSFEALEFFDSKVFDNNVSKFVIRNDIISSSIQLKEYATADKYINENLGLLTPGSFNWFKLLNFQFLNSSMKEDYSLMAGLVSKVFSSPHFKSYEIHYQSWLIKEAYIHFLIRMGKVDIEILEKHPLRPFRLNRFLNEVPIYSKDKRGLNISILIIQMLFLIEQRKFNNVIDRMDALKQYTYRYLRNDTSFRSNCFIKMLLKIPDAGFHHLRVQRHVSRLYDKLSNTPMELSDQSSEIEVIPYEKLWDIVIELLQRDKSL